MWDGLIYCICHSWYCYDRRLERRKQYTSVFVKRLRKRLRTNQEGSSGFIRHW